MKNKKLIWIAGIIFLIISIAVGIFAFSFLRSGLFAKPEIILFQPTEPLIINLSEGIVFIAEGRSDKGINHIEFKEDGIIKSKKYPQEAGADALLTHISWMPEEIGIYELTFTAIDESQTSSDPAQITIGVISPGLSQQDVDKTTETIAQAEIINVALPAPADNDSPSAFGSGDHGIGEGAQDHDEANEDERQEDNQGDGDHGIGEGAQDHDEANEDERQEDNQGDGDHGIGEGAQDHDEANEDERPDVSDLPPEIITFDLDYERSGNGILVTINATAQDNHKLSSLFLEIQGGPGPIYNLHHCREANPCNASFTEILSIGNYTAILYAEDNLQQRSEIRYLGLEISSDANQNGEPALIIDYGGNIPPEALDRIFEILGNGIFQMYPVQNIGWVGFEQEEEDECAPSTIMEAEISVEQYWGGGTPFIDLRCKYPCNMQSVAEDPLMCVEVREIGMFCDPEAWRFLCPAYLVFTRDGPHYDQPTLPMYYPELDRDFQLCGRETGTFTPVMIENGIVVERGNPVQITPLPCPPLPPAFIKLEGRDHDCPENKPYCLIATWRKTRDESLINRLNIDHYVLKEQVHFYRHDHYSSTDKAEYILDADTSYFYVTKYVTPNAVYEYEIYAVSPEGIPSSSSRINMRTNTEENFSTSDWQEDR